MAAPSSILRLPLACLLTLALPAAAQTRKKTETFKPDSIEARAQKRCKENRGTDCDSRAGLREWIREETPITKEQQQAAAAARRHREECKRNKNKPGC